ncbi:ABC transporter permease subunit [Bacillus sp. UMB0893]|uniref:ABC transporter permease subunit n=1 Tax=Bacillus sp. UMB0893 TaxID=2066053 RepID=UPI000C7661E8|nr:ABC transporter permease subunit [Bacillus sp. UMB0893]PLR66262.1 sugar ABC transporter permease [Bacillus sp. UMB0893]
MKAIKRNYSLYLMLIPIFIYFVLFSYYPLIRGFIISLQDFRIIGDRPFVGLDNYLTVLKDPAFLQASINTFAISGGILILGFIIPIIIAISLNEVINQTFKRFTQTVIYLPHLFSWVVVGGIWIFLLSPDGGLVNELLMFFGNEQSVHFLVKEDLAKPIIILTAIWKDMGYICILYLAAIVGINPALYEAASIDGANRWHKIRFVTLPQLVPTMKIVLLLNIMGILRIFDQIFILVNPAIANEINVFMTYTYEKGILQFQMGIASAAAFLVLLMTMILTFVTRKLIRYDEENL